MQEANFVADSLLEEAGFELAVPPRTKQLWGAFQVVIAVWDKCLRFSCRRLRFDNVQQSFLQSGTDGSNPASLQLPPAASRQRN